MSASRRRSARLGATLALVALSLAACGGPGATATPGSDGSGPTPAATTGGPPAPGGATVTVTLGGGEHEGTYTATDNPNCTHGLVGPDGWGVQYSVAEAGSDELSSLQLILAGEGQADDENAFMQGVELMTTATIGPLTDGTDYEIRVTSADAGEPSQGEGQATVERDGDAATIRVEGTTADGVPMTVVVDCPSVMEMGA